MLIFPEEQQKKREKNQEYQKVYTSWETPHLLLNRAVLGNKGNGIQMNNYK